MAGTLFIQKEKYLIVVEKTQTGFSAYSPDVLGCISTGKTMEQTLSNIKSALQLHLKAMVEDSENIPVPKGVESHIEVERESEGEEYFLTHISVESVLPNEVVV